MKAAKVRVAEALAAATKADARGLCFAWCSYANVWTFGCGLCWGYIYTILHGFSRFDFASTVILTGVMVPTRGLTTQREQFDPGACPVQHHTCLSC